MENRKPSELNETEIMIIETLCDDLIQLIKLKNINSPINYSHLHDDLLSLSVEARDINKILDAYEIILDIFTNEKETNG